MAKLRKENANLKSENKKLKEQLKEKLMLRANFPIFESFVPKEIAIDGLQGLIFNTEMMSNSEFNNELKHRLQ